MQKKIFMATIVVFIISAFPFVTLADENRPIKILLDGKEIVLDQPPVIMEDRALVPVRAITESLGATVSTDFSDSENRLVYISMTGYKVTLKIGSTTALINTSTIVEMDIPATIINGRTLVPLRFVAENFAAEVEWAEQDRIIAIYKGRGTPVKIDPTLMPVYKVPMTKVGFESNYSPAPYSKLTASDRAGLDGNLFYVDGFVEEILAADTSGNIAAIVNDGGNRYRMLINNMRFGSQDLVGKFYRFYGAFMSNYNDIPTIMLLRATDYNGGVISAETSGFTIATAFEGDPIESAEQIKAFLDKNLQNSTMGTNYFVFDVKKSGTCDFAVVIGFNESHSMGNALRFANITDTQRGVVEDSLKKHMRIIAFALIQKCPDLTLEGYYYDRLTGVDDNGERAVYTMRHASWTNNPNAKGVSDGAITWLPGEDSSWYSE